MTPEAIIEKKDHYYDLAHTSYVECDKSDFEIIPSNVKNRSISLLLDDELMPTPVICIKLDLFIKEDIIPIGYYALYIDINKNFVDEFLSLE